MTVPKLLRKGNGQHTPHRSGLRKQLRAAGQGEVQAFQVLFEHYLDFVSEYLYLAGVTVDEQLDRHIVRVFSKAWARIQYANRVSDLERLLTLLVMNREIHGRNGVGSDLQCRLLSLSRQDVFLLVAVELESWHLQWTGLACRMTSNAIAERLLKIRCDMIGLDLDAINTGARECLYRISRDLDRKITLKERAHLCRRQEQFPQIRDFRSRWLNIRCELIEFRQQIRLGSDRRRELHDFLVRELTPDQLIHPQWVDRVSNWVRFSNFPDPKMD